MVHGLDATFKMGMGPIKIGGIGCPEILCPSSNANSSLHSKCRTPTKFQLSKVSIPHLLRVSTLKSTYTFSNKKSIQNVEYKIIVGLQQLTSEGLFI